MRQIVKGHVFDLGYGGFERVCGLLPKITTNAVGKPAAVDVELRKDKATGIFYLFSTCEGGYSSDPMKNSIEIVPEEQAKAIAAEFVEYGVYKTYFPDPEGGDAGLKRRTEDAERKAKDSEESKNYWYGEHCKLKAEADKLKAADETKDGTIAQLKSEIEALKEKISLLTPDGRG